MSIPSRIPRKRGYKSKVATAIVAIALALLGIALSNEEEKLNALCSAIVIFSCTYVVIEFIYRVCLMVEEVDYLGSRYETIVDIFKQTFDFSKLYVSACFIIIFALTYICLTNADPLQSLYSKVCYLASVLLIFNLLEPKHGSLYQALSIANLNGLDFGSAMAHSFFNGYLRIVLPCKGTEQRGIKELMKDFESNEGITFDHDRLIVLIPLSMHCPASADLVSNITEKSKSLDFIQLDRAGVRERIYKNTAYSIKKIDETTKVYVCIEYATPLMTLKETISNNTEHSNIYKLQRKEIVLQFYLTLQAILDGDQDCKDCCDLLLYDDLDEHGEAVDVGLVVLDHINKQKKKLKKL